MSSMRPIARLLRDERGNIAMMFGLMIFVIFGGAGIAIDMQRSGTMRAAVAEATDAAALAAARYKSAHPGADDATLTMVARRVFDHDLGNSQTIDVASFSLSFDDASDTFVANVDAVMNTLIMGILGQKTIDVSATSEVSLGKPPLLEIALALDVTGSMNQNGKISAMRNAAKDLIETMFEADEADVKIGIVPFAQYASIGTDYNSASWLSNPGGAFKGCIGSRNYPYNTVDTDYDTQKTPGLVGAPCPDPLMPLSTDEAALLNKIDDLDANGWTYIPAGLNPAWQLLTPTEPFAEGLSFEALEEANGTKAIILMTDGENTRAPDYPTHNSASAVLANELTVEICVNIKKQPITVYMIAFDVSDTNIKDILEDCATSPSHYFDATDADALRDAFASIANSLRSISLSK